MFKSLPLNHKTIYILNCLYTNFPLHQRFCPWHALLKCNDDLFQNWQGLHDITVWPWNCFLFLFQVATYTGYSDSFFSSGKPHYHTKQENFSMFNQAVRVKKNSKQTYSGASTIPSLPPSILEGCNIINLQYFIIVSKFKVISQKYYQMTVIYYCKPTYFHEY